MTKPRYLLLRVVLSAIVVVGTTSGATLEELYAQMKAKMPTKDSDEYVYPTSSQLNDFELIVDDMMEGLTCSGINLRSLQTLYDISNVQDDGNNKNYCVLSAKTTASSWGNVIVYQNTTSKNLSIDCPHPLNDSKTGEQGIAVFKGTDARSFIVSGSHRGANSNSSTCQSSYEVADAAHNTNVGFHHASKAILDYYESSSTDYTAIQFHGMGSTSCANVDVFFTHGRDIPPTNNEKITIFRDEFNAVNPPTNGNSYEVPGGANPCTLIGSTNTQGRLINGISNSNVCLVPASGYTGRFIHVEQKYDIRHSSLHGKWVDALNNAYTKFATADPPTAVTVTSPNGGEIVGQGTIISVPWTSTSGVNQADTMQISVGVYDNDGLFDYEYDCGGSPTISTGSYDCRIKTSYSVGEYVMRIRNVNNNNLLDYSDNTFSVVKPFELVQPNGGEEIVTGTQYEIKWDVTSNLLGAGVSKVQLTVCDPITKNYVRNIISETDNDGSFIWTIPTNLSLGDYIIRIRNTDYTSSKDYSDASFTIIETRRHLRH